MQWVLLRVHPLHNLAYSWHSPAASGHEDVQIPKALFCLFRCPAQDMNIIITALKQKLGAFGWSEVLRRDRPREFKLPVGEVEDLDQYLQQVRMLGLFGHPEHL